MIIPRLKFLIQSVKEFLTTKLVGSAVWIFYSVSLFESSTPILINKLPSDLSHYILSHQLIVMPSDFHYFVTKELLLPWSYMTASLQWLLKVLSQHKVEHVTDNSILCIPSYRSGISISLRRKDLHQPFCHLLLELAFTTLAITRSFSVLLTFNAAGYNYNTLSYKHRR